ncbi:hypothetical protein ERO13_A05G056125v2 [Gossypium hirsutum]|nr:hypothetical protein ERO13_A05G056125v2 [Gossypium hirsutum]
MESKLQACQQYIHTLEASLQEEMSRHALSMVWSGSSIHERVGTLSRIHEEGLRQIHASNSVKALLLVVHLLSHIITGYTLQRNHRQWLLAATILHP